MSGQATTLAELREAATRVHCDCYHPDEMEYDPAGMCARCQLIAMIDGLLLDSGANR